MGFHHLVNTRYFSEAAIDWKKNGGRYTTAPKGSRDYFQYWEEQERRCKFGYKVGDLWIPGRFYDYLNFFPMSRVPQQVMMKALEERRDAHGKLSVTTAEKVVEFPAFWEVQYEWQMFKHIAWYGGEFMGIKSPGGKHLCALKSRGAGWSYSEAHDGVYNYKLIGGSKSYFFAAAEPYLVGDAIMDKVQAGLDWVNEYCPYWKQNRQVKKSLMHQKASYLDAYGVEKGKMSEIIGQIVDKPSKAHPYSANIITPDGPKKWSEIQIGSRVFGSDGTIINVTATVELGEQDIYTMTLEDGRTVQCTLDHLWNVSNWRARQKNLEIYTSLVEETVDTSEIIKRLNQSWNKTDRVKIKFNECTKYPEQPVPIESYTLGLLLGDGSIKRATKNITPLTMMHEDVEAIKQFVPYEIKKANWGTGIRNTVHIPNGKQLFTDLGLIDKVCGTKFIPDVYKYNSKEIRLAVINGLLDTDGSCTKDFGVIEYSTKSEQMAKDFIWIIHSLGFGGTIKSRQINGATYYRCYVYCLSEELSLFNLPRKKALVCTKKTNGKAVNFAKYAHVKSVEFSHREQAKCIQVDADDSLYLIEDHIVTHNTRGKRGRKASFEEFGSFPHGEKALRVALGSLSEGSAYVGQASVFGTGGEQGPGIQALENIFGNPDAWDMLAFPNVWEPGMEMTSCGYFVPCYRVNSWFMDEQGNVDLEAAVQADEEARLKAATSGKPKDLDDRKAEYPRTPSEALQRLNGNGFNIAEIDAQIRRIDTNQAIQGLLRHGTIIGSELTKQGVEFLLQSKDKARPIEDYPHKQNDDLNGCFTIVQRPYHDQNGNVPDEMYMISFDSYYKDESDDLTSLFSFKVWKQSNNIDPSYEDLPVAWFAGRRKNLTEVIDLMFKAAKLYNARIQGEISGGGQAVVTHAKTYRLLQWLKNEPEMVHNKELASKSSGNSFLMNMATERKKLAITYLEDWHMMPRGVDESGNLIYNIQHIYDRAFLMEMKKFNPAAGNFDRISDALVAMFELKERKAIMIKSKKNGRSILGNRILFGGTNTSIQGTTSSY